MALLVTGCVPTDGLDSFCETVPPLIDGRVPSSDDLRSVVRAATELGGDDGETVREAAQELDRELVAYRSGARSSYHTGVLVEPVAEICGLELFSESAEDD